MQYDWSKILSPEETIEKEFRISAKYRTFILVGCIVAGMIIAFWGPLGGVAVLLLGLVYWYYLTKAKHYAFTKKRIILVDSFLGINVTSIDYTQLTDIVVDQNVFDQFGGWGTLILNTAGTHSLQTHISFIDNPSELKQLLDSIRDSHPPTVQVANNVS